MWVNRGDSHDQPMSFTDKTLEEQEQVLKSLAQDDSEFLKKLVEDTERCVPSGSFDTYCVLICG